MKKISILGSTGSIGTQSLEVIRNIGGYKVLGLTSNSKVDMLVEQILEFEPLSVAIGSEIGAKQIVEKLEKADYNKHIDVYFGQDGLKHIARDKSEIVINALVGMVGLIPTLEAIELGKDLALANKETLVTAGELVMRRAKEKGVNIFPIDSEHSAIYQCMIGEKKSGIEKLIITASGGPFRGRSRESLKDVSVRDALNHPNWAMGSKITIDSATLMNKGLEIIEAAWLFDMDIDMIEPIVHPQSIIHSMVEYVDGSTIAHLGCPDMKVPIQYALTHPDRCTSGVKGLDFREIAQLSFEEVDRETFKSISLSIESFKRGGTMPTVLNGANEKLVELFLSEKIGFLDIVDGVEAIIGEHSIVENPRLEDILEADRWARERVLDKYS